MNNVKKLKILLVEDNKTALTAHSEMIKRVNNTLDIAETGEEALLKASTEQYDLIFMDIGLPDIDGIEVTEKIRALELTKKKKATIIGLTAFDLDDVQQECLSAGMNKVIQKPVSFAVLAHLINALKRQKNISLLPQHSEQEV